MRFTQRWLEEWVTVDWGLDALVHRLTMAGLEVEGTEDLSAGLEGVVVGRVVTCEAHPNADRLSLCQVDAGEGEQRQIVCGATNMGPGDKVPVALPKAVLPNGMAIKKSKMRGEVSEGMMCSAAELGLGDGEAGLLILPAEAPVGTPLADYLDRHDTAVEVDLTPNRGDCLSILGVAREVAALADRPLADPDPGEAPVAAEAAREVELEAGADCPRYLGRVLAGVDAGRETPLWMAERLRRCGVRPVSLVVDVTNYVMLELGQPLHAFDNEQLRGAVRVRHAASQEPVTLLDGSEAALEAGALVVADDAGVQAVAGVMGAAGSAVDTGTSEVFLEAAHFRPGAVAGRARKLGQHTDASHRFERGVDPEMPRRALERATALLLELAGGRAGPVTAAEYPGCLPAPEAIPFHPAECDVRLGTALGADTMADIFRRLGLRVSEAGGERWQVMAPSFRFDLAREADLMEEVARVHGYDRLPAASPRGELAVPRMPEMALGDRLVKRLLTDRGYQEVITFSFVDPSRAARLNPGADPLALANPLAADQSVMRVDLFPGLLEVVARNQARQGQRLRLFEVGRIFPTEGGRVAERDALGGALAGPVDPPHWDGRRRGQDFFDAKGDLEALLERAGVAVTFEPAEHPALHPGQTARLRCGGETVGWLGTLHPSHAEPLEVAEGVVLFQLDLTALRGQAAALPGYEAVPRLPASHRDLAVVLEEGVGASDVAASLPAEPAGLRLMDWHIFDIYTGQGVEPGTKSVALSLTLQAYDHTPTDEQIDQAVQAVTQRLAEGVGARLRQ